MLEPAVQAVTVKIKDCPQCMMFYFDQRNAMLIEACASVGISLGRSTNEMLVAYLSRYHRNKHKIN